MQPPIKQTPVLTPEQIAGEAAEKIEGTLPSSPFTTEEGIGVKKIILSAITQALEQEKKEELGLEEASTATTRVRQKGVDSPASYYAALIPRLRVIAAKYGYALALHGSMNRDFDLILVPWQEWANQHLEMVTEMRDALGGFFHSPDPQFESLIKDGAVSKKPHGRLSYSIHLSSQGMEGPYLDISVAPSVPPTNATLEHTGASSQEIPVPSGGSEHASRVSEDIKAFNEWSCEVDAQFNPNYLQGAENGWHAALRYARTPSSVSGARKRGESQAR